jgi:MoaA/NifB/PqqE/SkfB family radical SAM enzyme
LVQIKTLNLKPALRKIIRQSNYAFSPHKAAIEITQNCNLRCPACPRQHNKITGESMSVEKFKHILNKLPMLRLIHIIGQGEPLLHPKIKEIVKYTKSLGIDISFTTNGAFLKKEILLVRCVALKHRLLK